MAAQYVSAQASLGSRVQERVREQLTASFHGSSFYGPRTPKVFADISKWYQRSQTGLSQKWRVWQHQSQDLLGNVIERAKSQVGRDRIRFAKSLQDNLVSPSRGWLRRARKNSPVFQQRSARLWLRLRDGASDFGRSVFQSTGNFGKSVRQRTSNLVHRVQGNVPVLCNRSNLLWESAVLKFRPWTLNLEGFFSRKKWLVPQFPKLDLRWGKPEFSWQTKPQRTSWWVFAKWQTAGQKPLLTKVKTRDETSRFGQLWGQRWLGRTE